MQHRDYFTSKQAAHYLTCAASTLAKRRVNGSGPLFTRIGRSIRYRRQDLDAWMEGRLSASTSERNSDRGKMADSSAWTIAEIDGHIDVVRKKANCADLSVDTSRRS